MPEENRQLVLLFVDVPSAVHVRDQRGNDAATDFLAEVTAQIGRVRKQHGGQEVRSVGSTVLCTFDDPAAALRAACDMRQLIGINRIVGVHPRLRIGIHFGNVTVRGHSFYGEAVSVSARLVALASPGQILVTRPVYDRLGPAETRVLCQVAMPQDWAVSVGELFCVIADQGDTPPTSIEQTQRDLGEVGRTSTRSMVQTGPLAQRRVQLMRLQENARGEHKEDREETYSHTARLCLIRRGSIVILDHNTPSMSIGREEGSDVILDLTTASRRHAHVELRPEGFFLVDHSWNGTYVYDEEGIETHVHNAEHLLINSGVISPGAPGSASEVEAIRFIETR